jgi:Asp-tRNA(Asn)/Glu-tRNA(Gln) amidotransferase A subunit family amidase
VTLNADDADPITWPIERLTRAFAAEELSPVDVARQALERIEQVDGDIHAFVTVTPELATSQAAAATAEYRQGGRRPLLGVPISVKDVFHMAGTVSTLGSLVHRRHVVPHDSGVVRRLRAAGAVFVGKTNTAEFGQSATTDNRLGPDTANPWDPTRTAGGSSGGAAASVAAGMAVAAVGSDGGGSIRIPSAFTGVVGLKPTIGSCPDEDGFRAMTQFSCPGPLTRRVADARVVLEVLTGRPHPHHGVPDLRLGWCSAPEGRPVHSDVATAVAAAVELLDALGHHIDEVDLPLVGWEEIFGPLVLADEQRERGPLLEHVPDLLTAYERRTLEAARHLQPDDVSAAHKALDRYRGTVRALFTRYDYLVTPATAVPAFPLRHRPGQIQGRAVSKLWGPFPFAAPFNVAGLPAVSLPCGHSSGLPVAVQLIGAPGDEAGLLNLCQQLEVALASPH